MMSMSHQLFVLELVSVCQKHGANRYSLCCEPVITCDQSMLPQHDSNICTVHVATKHNFMLQNVTWNEDRMVSHILQF